MRTDNQRGSFEDVIRNSSPQIAAISYKLRELIAQVYPDVVELPRPAEQHIKYALGSDKVNQAFGYICPMQDYVRLGFYYGGGLPDPFGLLVGEGKRLRHIKIHSQAEAEHPGVRQLLEAAVRERE